MKYTKLYSVLFGSKLYGTSTPTSDRDVKYLVLPDLGEILIGKQPKNLVKKTNTEKNTRNTVDDVDEEYIPIQVFARDFMMGQTYAIEMAFSIDGNHAEQTFPPDSKSEKMVREFIMELRQSFLTSNIKAMMGYVVNQASMYSLKGERLNAIKKFMELMIDLTTDDRTKDVILEKSLAEMYEGHSGFHFRVKEIEDQFPKYFKITEYDIGDGRMRPCFMLLDKCLPFTSTMVHTLGVVRNQFNKYGNRAEQASQSTADWKATMHALRIVDEGLSLLKNHTLTLPLSPERAAELLSIKRGEVELNTVMNELDDKLDRLKLLEEHTALPRMTQSMQMEFEAWLTRWMFDFYSSNGELR